MYGVDQEAAKSYRGSAVVTIPALGARVGDLDADLTAIELDAVVGLDCVAGRVGFRELDKAEALAGDDCDFSDIAAFTEDLEQTVRGGLVVEVAYVETLCQRRISIRVP